MTKRFDIAQVVLCFWCVLKIVIIFINMLKKERASFEIHSYCLFSGVSIVYSSLSNNSYVFSTLFVIWLITLFLSSNEIKNQL